MSDSTSGESSAVPAHDVATSTVLNSGVARVPGFNGNYKAIELHLLATQFLTAAQEVKQPANAAHYVLLIHSIEVALKSFLHEKGIPEDVLAKEYRHKLDLLLSAAVEKGLRVSNSHTSDIISRLAAGAERARIRYDFTFQMPLLPDVISVATSLLSDTLSSYPGRAAPNRGNLAWLAQPNMRKRGHLIVDII